MFRMLGSGRPGHGTVVAYLALFVALGGSAYAAASASIGSNDIKPNAILSRHIKDGQVTSADVGASAITSAKIAANAITGADIKEQTLAQVPSAAHAAQAASATQATNATQAGNAALLGGQSASAFLPATNVVRMDSSPSGLHGQSTPLDTPSFKVHAFCYGEIGTSRIDLTVDATGQGAKVYWFDTASDNGGASTVKNSASDSGGGILVQSQRTAATADIAGTIVYRDDTQAITVTYGGSVTYPNSDFDSACKFTGTAVRAPA
ncbi:MAG: hypothetical protein ACJ764_13430 [Solirubrobacteraceae bacterium]